MRRFTPAEQFSLIYQMLTQYRSVARFPYLPQDKIRDFQFRKIKQLLDIAYNHTPFYRRKYDKAGVHPSDIRTWNDFHRLPVLTKEEMIENEIDLLDRRRPVKDLILSRSSGSTGKFVNIYLDVQTFITQELQVIRMLKDFYPQYGPLDKELLVYTSEYPFRSIGGFYQVEYINNLMPAERILQAMKRLRPAIVAIYPSILREVVELDESECRKFGLKAIVTNSEHVPQAQLDHFETIFGCPVFDEYSSEELSSIAYQCKDKTYHLTQDSSYIEIAHPDEDAEFGACQPGEIVGTCLINFAMPIIRYRQGDLATLSDQTCACERSGAIFHEFCGRKNASFKKTDGRDIPSGRILDWTYSLVLAHKVDIREFQVTQKTMQEIEITLVPGAEYNPNADGNKLINSFRETFGLDFEIEIVLVREIPKTQSGKHIPIRSLV